MKGTIFIAILLFTAFSAAFPNKIAENSLGSPLLTNSKWMSDVDMKIASLTNDEIVLNDGYISFKEPFKYPSWEFVYTFTKAKSGGISIWASEEKSMFDGMFKSPKSLKGIALLGNTDNNEYIKGFSLLKSDGTTVNRNKVIASCNVDVNDCSKVSMRFVVKKCSQEKATGDLIVQYYKGNKWTVCANKKEVTLPKNVYYGFGATSEKVSLKSISAFELAAPKECTTAPELVVDPPPEDIPTPVKKTEPTTTEQKKTTATATTAKKTESTKQQKTKPSSTPKTVNQKLLTEDSKKIISAIEEFTKEIVEDNKKLNQFYQETITPLKQLVVQSSDTTSMKALYDMAKSSKDVVELVIKLNDEQKALNLDGSWKLVDGVHNSLHTFVDTLESLTNWLDASSLKTISAVGSTKSFSSLSWPMLLVIAEIATLFCLFAYNAYADHKKKNLYIVE